MNYDDWKVTAKSAALLCLDPSNPRIPPSTKQWTQKELIIELTLHDDVLDLAKNIAANNFFPSEPLIAVKERLGFVVVEGNRRLAACKLLMNHELAPENLRTKFRLLSATFDQKELRKVPVLIAPSREATIPLIIARHTSTQIAKWQPAMQAHFYHTLVSSGATIDEVAAKFHLPPGDVRKALISHNLYSMACRLDLDPAAAAIVRDPRKFSLSTLMRVFDVPEAREFLGVEFDDSGVIIGKTDPKEFAKGFGKVVTEVAKAEIDSRKLNTPEDVTKHLRAYGAKDSPDLTKKGSFDSSNFMIKKAPAAVSKPKPAKKSAAKPPSKSLFHSGLICNCGNQRVRELFSELRKLPLANYPNAAAFAFRCFLELSLHSYLDPKGEVAKMRAAEIASIASYNAKLKPGQKPRSLPPNWTPGLYDMLTWVAKPQNKVIVDGHLLKALSVAMRDEKDLIALNLVVHNPLYPASETRLRESFRRLEPLIKLLIA